MGFSFQSNMILILYRQQKSPLKEDETIFYLVLFTYQIQRINKQKYSQINQKKYPQIILSKPDRIFFLL